MSAANTKKPPPRAPFPNLAPSRRCSSLLLGLVPFRSLQGALEPRQPLVPHTLPLVADQRRDDLQRPYRVRFTAERHLCPSVGLLEGELRCGSNRSHHRLELDVVIGLDSRVTHRSLTNLSQRRCLLTHQECGTRLDRSLRGLLHRSNTRIRRWDVGQIQDEPEYLLHRPFDDHCGLHSPPVRPAQREPKRGHNPFPPTMMPP